ncbi:glycosyltransferase [Candidatus Woesebacteria bacterium]|nr:glycosyltransferase [Candidatus Woesebacteria bacterium]
MKKTPLISIILPVYYEQNNIIWTLSQIHTQVKYRHEILIIYDNDSDPTVKTVKTQTRSNNIKIIKNSHGTGVLNAIKTGFENANGEVYVVMAADRTDSPKTINSMFVKILQGYDLVCPTRYSLGGKVIGKNSLKSILSRLAGTSTPFALGIPTSDLTYSFKMFRKTLLKKIPIQSKSGFEFSEEMTIKAHLYGFKIVEVPTIWRDRKYGVSKFKLIQWLPSYMYWFIWGFIRRHQKHSR